MKRLSIAAVLSALLAGAGCHSAMAYAGPLETFQRYVRAANAADMEAVGALISEHVERSDFVGCTPAMDDKACLVHYIRTTVVAAHGRLNEISTELHGDTVQARVELRSSLTAKVGVERVVGTDVVRVADGQIVAFRFVPDFNDDQTVAFFAALGVGPGARKP